MVDINSISIVNRQKTSELQEIMPKHKLFLDNKYYYILYKKEGQKKNNALEFFFKKEGYDLAIVIPKD